MMGNKDTAEQLEAAQAECVRLERELAAAQRWRETAEVILGGVTVQGVPALDFIAAAIRAQSEEADR